MLIELVEKTYAYTQCSECLTFQITLGSKCMRSSRHMSKPKCKYCQRLALLPKGFPSNEKKDVILV